MSYSFKTDPVLLCSHPKGWCCLHCYCLLWDWFTETLFAAIHIACIHVQHDIWVFARGKLVDLGEQYAKGKIYEHKSKLKEFRAFASFKNVQILTSLKISDTWGATMIETKHKYFEN